MGSRKGNSCSRTFPARVPTTANYSTPRDDFPPYLYVWVYTARAYTTRASSNQLYVRRWWRVRRRGARAGKFCFIDGFRTPGADEGARTTPYTHAHTLQTSGVEVRVEYRRSWLRQTEIRKLTEPIIEYTARTITRRVRTRDRVRIEGIEHNTVVVTI